MRTALKLLAGILTLLFASLYGVVAWWEIAPGFGWLSRPPVKVDLIVIDVERGKVYLVNQNT